VQPVVAGLGAEFMTVPLAEAEGRVVAEAVDRVLDLAADVVAIGPGLGAGPGVAAFVRAMLARAETPLILDADALNACAGDPAMLVGREDRPVIITPHPGEMARLVGCATEDVQANRLGLAAEFAARHGVTVVLKGYRTIIATPGGDVFVNPTGSPGMATAGSGDVLTGMLAAALAQLLDPATACQLAVYLHGAAGNWRTPTRRDVDGGGRHRDAHRRCRAGTVGARTRGHARRMSGAVTHVTVGEAETRAVAEALAGTLVPGDPCCCTATSGPARPCS
jgi:NAD(P)H-hydrate epimerase